MPQVKKKKKPSRPRNKKTGKLLKTKIVSFKVEDGLRDQFEEQILRTRIKTKSNLDASKILRLLMKEATTGGLASAKPESADLKVFLLQGRAKK